MVQSLEKISNADLRLWVLGDYGKLDTDRIRIALHDEKRTKVNVVYVGSWPPKLRPLKRMVLYIPLIIRSKFVIHLGADGFSDEAVGGSFSTFYHGAQILASHYLRKPVLLLSVTVGPFKNALTRNFALFVLHRTNGISVRGGSSERYLKQIGFEGFNVVADLSFLLKNTHRVSLNSRIDPRPYVCLVLNRFLENRLKKYIDIMAFVTDSVCMKGFRVIIVVQRLDEYTMAKKVYSKVSDKSSVEIMTNLIPSDMKDLFRHSRLVISSKFHSSILSFSTLTPTITLNYAQKVGDLHEMMNMSQYVLELGSSYDDTAKELLQKIDDALNLNGNANEWKKSLYDCQEQSLRNVELLRRWLV